MSSTPATTLSSWDVSMTGGVSAPTAGIPLNTEESEQPARVRLKCHYNNEIRLVRINGGASFSQLLARLREDYGFELKLKYEDQEGDLITLASQNDLNELFEGASVSSSSRIPTISVYVFDNCNKPSIHKCCRGNCASRSL